MKKNIIAATVEKITTQIIILFLLSITGYSQQHAKPGIKTGDRNQRIFYGNASFYANKFHGRRTANGDIFNQDKFTAACNILPLGTWIKVTNLNNRRSVICKTTDRLHPKMRRLVDLSSSAAKELGYIKNGLTRVKVEVINQKKAYK